MSKYCAYCGEETNSAYAEFCSRGCWDEWNYLEYDWTVDLEGLVYLGAPLPKLYVATVSTYAGQVEKFTNLENAEQYVFNHRGWVSHGDMKRTVKINLEKS